MTEHPDQNRIPRGPPGAGWALAIYRLVQEALKNVCGHAKATRVPVSVKSEPILVKAQIEDDGIAFDPSGPRLAAHGIAGMRFRIEQLDGRMSVASSPGAGTLLEAIMPVTLAAAAAGLISAFDSWLGLQSRCR